MENSLLKQQNKLLIDKNAETSLRNIIKTNIKKAQSSNLKLKSSQSKNSLKPSNIDSKTWNELW